MEFERSLTTHDLNNPRVIYGVKEETVQEFFGIPKTEIPELAVAYVNSIETEKSNKWCKCEWVIHPDDADIQDGHCRKCEYEKDHLIHVDELGNPECKFLGRRMRRGDEHSQCPVHTRVGFILGFFEFIFAPEMAEVREKAGIKL